MTGYSSEGVNRQLSKALAVDFDGVIHTYERGWLDGEIYGDPIEGAFDALRHLRLHYQVIIYTSRARHEGGVEAIRAWFREHEAGDLQDLEITDGKPVAMAYIDDRAIRFHNWSDALDALNRLERHGYV